MCGWKLPAVFSWDFCCCWCLLLDRGGVSGKGLQVRKDKVSCGGRWCLEVLSLWRRESGTSEMERCLCPDICHVRLV